MTSKVIEQIMGRLKLLRERAGISESDLEQQLIVGPGWITRFEASEVIPTIDLLLVILDLIGATPNQLLEGIELHDSGVEVQRTIYAEPAGDDLLVHFRYAEHDATYRLPGATLEELETVISTLRDGLAELVKPDVQQGAVKTDAVAKTFIKAVETWPHANSSDVWWFVIYRAYCDPFNHPARYARLDHEQSWKRTSGWALEEVCVRYYGAFLKEHGINLSIATRTRKTELVAQLDVSERLEADKVDVLLSGDTDEGEMCFGVVHVKASFAERRTDDVPMSHALVRAGYTSPLWTMDAKSGPSENPANRGELGEALVSDRDQRSAKRRDIEDDGYFSACFSYNRNTVPTPSGQDAAARIISCDFSNRDDAFSRFIISEWERFKTR